MWRCVDPVLTDVSEECIGSIFRVEKSTSGEPASAGGCRLSQQLETTNYKNREGGSVGHMGTNREERGRVWVKVSKQVGE
jgi:hypothetical protein